MLLQNLILLLAVAAPLAKAVEGQRDRPISKANCSHPVKSGPCRKAVPRWFHNTESGQCERFSWGGCQPNGNNFASRSDCMKACPDKPVDVCELPAKSGPYLAAFTRWFHNAETGECEQFIWGGCQPNGNNFETIEECEAACEDICELEKKVGPCKAKLLRWFHNADTGECEPFDWGGCQPNANNFETLEACEASCQSPDTCSLPLDFGDCLAVFTLWGYSSVQGGCVEFTYTGCGGNANRFPTEEQCVVACG